jgi:hypothetical protein
MANNKKMPGPPVPLLTHPKRQERFLGALRSGLSVTRACHHAGVGRTAAYDYRKGDEAFARAWDEALEAGTDCLEEIAYKRAEEGSDALLIFLLKTRRREVYGNVVRQEHTGEDGARIQQDKSVRKEFSHRIAGLACRVPNRHLAAP